MQILFRAFLTIYFAHLLTDFVFQTNAMVSRKRNGGVSGYLLHGLIHLCTALLLAAFFLRGSIISWRAYLVLLLLTIFHILIDAAKVRLTQKAILPDNTRTYLADQFLHALTVLFAACFFAPGLAFHDLLALLGSTRNVPEKLLAVPVVYIAAVFGGGYLIRYLTRGLAEGLKSSSPDKPSERLQNAGLYIGWLERFLVITALLLQSPATIGLILTAKSIARYPEFKSERFAEYFLIGTLLSISVAILGGAFLAKLLLGQVRLP